MHLRTPGQLLEKLSALWRTRSRALPRRWSRPAGWRGRAQPRSYCQEDQGFSTRSSSCASARPVISKACMISAPRRRCSVSTRAAAIGGQAPTAHQSRSNCKRLLRVSGHAGAQPGRREGRARSWRRGTGRAAAAIGDDRLQKMTGHVMPNRSPLRRRVETFKRGMDSAIRVVRRHGVDALAATAGHGSRRDVPNRHRRRRLRRQPVETYGDGCACEASGRQAERTCSAIATRRAPPQVPGAAARPRSLQQWRAQAIDRA